MYRLRTLAERKVTSKEVLSFLTTVLGDHSPSAQQTNGVPNIRAMQKVENLYQGHGRGSSLESANGTAWGLLNAVTEYVDHARRARSNEYRMDSAWFGQGAVIKQRALDAALTLVA
jgi:hypothetical protein